MNPKETADNLTQQFFYAVGWVAGKFFQAWLTLVCLGWFNIHPDLTVWQVAVIIGLAQSFLPSNTITED